MRANYKLQRLYAADLPPLGQDWQPGKEQAHYLLHVLRMQPGDAVLLFDGKSGEWLARCREADRKRLTLQIEAQTRPQPPAGAKLVYCFAPLKQARLDYMVQKAVEMGAAKLQPVITQHTQISRLNNERMQANMIEAAEQCGLLTLAEAAEPISLTELLAGWVEIYGADARLIFCDEAQIAEEGAANAAGQNPLPKLEQLKAERNATAETAGSAANGGKPIPGIKPAPGLKTALGLRPTLGLEPTLGLLIGPEGGFSEAERKQLYACAFVRSIPLGPRIMRADTAAVAALAVVQSVLGDW